MSDTDIEIEDGILRVGNSSSPKNVAAAIAHSIYDHRRVEVRAIGAGAVNQTVKGIAIARGYVAPRGFNLVCVPGFTTIVGKEGGEISAIAFTVTVT